MRQAYAILGIGVVIVALGAGIAFHGAFRRGADTSSDRAAITITDNATATMSTLSLTSGAFQDGATIPAEFTCDAGADSHINPPLAIADVPGGAKSLALIMDDPDVPTQLHADGVFDHWILFNIPPPSAGGNVEIAKGMTVGTPGKNGRGQNQYTGPCPPPQYEPREHRYVFALYALDTTLDLPEGATKRQVLDAMRGHILAETRLVGRYARK